MERQFPRKGEYYRHFKGERYEILMIACESETKEKMVVYQNTERKEEIWVCPVSKFLKTTDAEVFEKTGYKYEFMPEESKQEKERALILSFLDLSSAEEKIKFMQIHRQDVTEEILSVIAESLEFAETQTDEELRYRAILDYLQTIAKYEGRRG